MHCSDHRLPVAALLEMTECLRGNMAEREKELFADHELELFRGCLVWLQDMHQDNKTKSKISGKAVTALTLIGLNLRIAGSLRDAEYTVHTKFSHRARLKPMKEKFQEVVPQCEKKLQEIKTVIEFHEERQATLQQSVYYTFYLTPAVVLLKDAVVFLSTLSD